MAKPLVSATKVLGVTPQAARRIVVELGLREMTGRGVSGVGHDLIIFVDIAGSGGSP